MISCADIVKATHSSHYTHQIRVAPETSKTYCSTANIAPNLAAADITEHKRCRCCCWLLSSNVGTGANKVMQDLILLVKQLGVFVKLVSCSTLRITQLCHSKVMQYLEGGQMPYMHITSKTSQIRRLRDHYIHTKHCARYQKLKDPSVTITQQHLA